MGLIIPILIHNQKLREGYTSVVARAAYRCMKDKNLILNIHNLDEVLRREPKRFQKYFNRGFCDFEATLTKAEINELVEAPVGCDSQDLWEQSKGIACWPIYHAFLELVGDKANNIT